MSADMSSGTDFFGTTNNFLTVFKAYSIEGKSLKIL